MRSSCIAQGTLLNALWFPNGEEVRKGGDVLRAFCTYSFCTYSFFSMAETNRTLQGNYAPVKNN